MTPTVTEVLDAARGFLGDPRGEEFTDETLNPFYQVAYSDLVFALSSVGASIPERVAIIASVAAGVESIDLAAQNLSDVAVIHSVMERRAGSTQWVPITPYSEMTPTTSTDLRGFEVTGGTLSLSPATYDRDLRIKYSTSGIAPASGPVGVPGCLHYMASKIASLALAVREEGMVGAQAFGADAAEQLERLVQMSVKQQQAAPIIRPPFRSRRG